MPVDASELRRAAADLMGAPVRVRGEARKVTQKSAKAVQQRAREIVRGSLRGGRSHLKNYPQAITFEMLGDLEAEIGPESGIGQGGRGRGVEFGSSNAAPIPHNFPALDAEEPKYAKGIADVAARRIWS